jgi:hypothetical protein
MARRYRDVAIALTADLGGPDNLNEPTRMIRHAAALTVQVAAPGKFPNDFAKNGAA